MEQNGQLRDASADGQVLHWPGQLVSAQDLRRSLNGQRELVVPAKAIITPLAAEELRSNGIKITRRATGKTTVKNGGWGYVLERPNPLVRTALQALERDGLELKELEGKEGATCCQWARVVAECVTRAECAGALVFCDDSSLICCVANKVPGLRAVAVASVLHVGRAASTIGANLIAVEVFGRTVFELRQIIRTVCRTAQPVCPPGVASALQELDGHAHR
jgi:hypothetical protein